MKKLTIFAFLLLILTGCSIKIPAGKYSTAPSPKDSGQIHLAGRTITMTENGRFTYSSWSDDSVPTIGHGGYVVFGNYLMLLFENGPLSVSSFSKTEKTCVQKDTQTIQFTVVEPFGAPLPAVNIYNINDYDQSTISQMDGKGTITAPIESLTKYFSIQMLGLEPIEVEVDGDKCYSVDITMAQKVNTWKRGDFKIAKLKKEGDQLYWKMPY